MPDPPDKGRPSSPPLSVEDADRLADSFTPFWEDPGTSVASGAIAAPSPNPGNVTAPMPAVEPIHKPIGKQTLLGIAPPVIQRPPTSFPPPAPMPIPAPVPKSVAPAAIPVPASVAVGLTQPLPATAPVAQPVPAAPEPAAPELAAPAAPEPAARQQVAPAPAPMPEPEPEPEQPLQPPAAVAGNSLKKTLLGYSDPSSAPAPASARGHTPIEGVLQSSPEVPGYAIAYTPKDPPSTPAVVIAPEAQSSPENLPPENKRPLSQTQPSIVRSAPKASVAPLPPPPVVVDDFNPYAKKGKGKLIGWSLGGALLLLGVALGVRELSAGGQDPHVEAGARPDVAPAAPAVAAAPTLAPIETAQAQPTPAEPAATEPPPAPVAARRASEPVPAPVPAKTKVKAKAESASAAARPTRSSASEASPSPTKPASKGVIVRDAPF